MRTFSFKRPLPATQHIARTLLALAAAVCILCGCASYRVSSNVKAPEAVAAATASAVLIARDDLPGRHYTEIGPLEVSVKKLTVFHADPTLEQANAALSERARAMGADAVIRVRYERGIGMTTWGYLDARGTAVKLSD